MRRLGLNSDLTMKTNYFLGKIGRVASRLLTRYRVSSIGLFLISLDPLAKKKKVTASKFSDLACQLASFSQGAGDLSRRERRTVAPAWGQKGWRLLASICINWLKPKIDLAYLYLHLFASCRLAALCMYVGPRFKIYRGNSLGLHHFASLKKK